MHIPPTYQLTRKITVSLQEIERLKARLDYYATDKTLEKYSRQKSLLKSSLFSARIEGNPQTLEQFENGGWINSREKQKLEVANLYRALEYVLSKSWRSDVTLDDLKFIHNQVMDGLSRETGFLRTEPSAIYNTAGIAIYVCPLPNEIKPLLQQLLVYVNQDFEPIIPIKTALSHIVFEKIHPFLDGNGRLGRLLIHLVLKKWQYDFRGLAPVEEYLDNNRQTYYDLLAENKQDRTEFIEFFLEGLIYGLKIGVSEKEIQKNKLQTPEQKLPPRRYEILQIIKDHKIVSFDFIKRRFFAIPSRTLRYDLKQLTDKQFIQKRGVTRGVVYEIIETEKKVT
ncbi:MAG: Fic family protein [Patescibacteria group bacterium]|jgi:Fic family protein